jgi:hypothetical protein
MTFEDLNGLLMARLHETGRQAKSPNPFWRFGGVEEINVLKKKQKKSLKSIKLHKTAIGTVLSSRNRGEKTYRIGESQPFRGRTLSVQDKIRPGR